mgnify:CR=1 FL=1
MLLRAAWAKLTSFGLYLKPKTIDRFSGAKILTLFFVTRKCLQIFAWNAPGANLTLSCKFHPLGCPVSCRNFPIRKRRPPKMELFRLVGLRRSSALPNNKTWMWACRFVTPTTILMTSLLPCLFPLPGEVLPLTQSVLAPLVYPEPIATKPRLSLSINATLVLLYLKRIRGEPPLNDW